MTDDELSWLVKRVDEASIAWCKDLGDARLKYRYEWAAAELYAAVMAALNAEPPPSPTLVGTVIGMAIGLAIARQSEGSQRLIDLLRSRVPVPAV